MSPKDWATARAKAAMRGVILMRTDPRDGPVRLVAVSSNGRVWMVHTLDDLEGLLL